MTSRELKLNSEELANVKHWEHTLRVCKRSNFKVKKSIKYNIQDLPELKEQNDLNGVNEDPVVNDLSQSLSQVNVNHFTIVGKIKEPESKIESKIEVLNMDTFDLAQQYVENHKYKTLVLNMASDIKPGGGVRNGRTAQEEDLFRRSNAQDTHPESMYPLKSFEIIYSPRVTVIKDAQCDDLAKPFAVGMIACAGIRHPPTVGSGPNVKFKNPEDVDLMRSKINAIFHVAVLHGFEALVLGGLGCGVFACPPKEVAALFKEAIEKYGHHFTKIGFAVLVVRKDRDQFNLDAFSKILLK